MLGKESPVLYDVGERKPLELFRVYEKQIFRQKSAHTRLQKLNNFWALLNLAQRNKKILFFWSFVSNSVSRKTPKIKL